MSTNSMISIKKSPTGGLTPLKPHLAMALAYCIQRFTGWVADEINNIRSLVNITKNYPTR